MSKFGIISKKGWGKKKPVERVVVDWNNPISKGLIFCLPLNNSTYDIASKDPKSLTGNAFVDRDGLHTDGTGDYLTVCAASALVGNDITIIVKSRPDTTANNSLLGCATATGSATSRINAHVPYSGTVYWDFGRNDSGGRVSVANTVSTTEFATWAFTARAAVNLEIFKDGTSIASTGAGDSSGFTGSTYDFTVGRFNSTSPVEYDGTIEYVYIFNRCLTDGEIQQITEDPYQLLKPAANKPFFLKTYDNATVYDPNAETATEQVFAPKTGTLTIDGKQPTVAATGGDIVLAVTPTTGTVTIDGQQPTVTTTTSILKAFAPVTGTLTIDGQQPTFVGSTGILLAATPTTGTVTIDGKAPTLSIVLPQTFAPTTGTVTIDGKAPTVSLTGLDLAVTPTTGTLALDGKAPTATIALKQTFAPTTGTVTIDGKQPSVSATIPVAFAPTTGTVTIVGQQPTLTTLSHIAATPIAANMVISGSAPNVTTITASRWYKKTDVSASWSAKIDNSATWTLKSDNIIP